MTEPSVEERPAEGTGRPSGTQPPWSRLLGDGRGRLGLQTLAVLALLAVLYQYGSSTPFRANQMTLWALQGILALSLVFVWGKGGIFSFGQGAFYGVGAYTYGIFAINFSDATNETLSAVLVAVVVAAMFAAALGYFMFYGNLGEIYVAIITLATTLVLATFVGATAGPHYRIGEARLGGYNGMIGIPPITIGWPGGSPHALSGNQLLAVTLVLAAVLATGLAWLLRRPFGRIVAGMRTNEPRTQLLGYDNRAYKLVVFAIGGGIAGLAGAWFAAWGLFVNPAVFGLTQAALIIIWVLVGGYTSLLGAFIGVTLVQALSARLGGGAGSLTPVVLGAVLIAVVLLLPQGLVPTVRRRLASLLPWIEEQPQALPDPALPVDPVEISAAEEGSERLGTNHVTKAFGGLVAVREVTLSFPPVGAQCLIGPNGAGKSTLFNLLVGRHQPTAGRILLGERDITRRKPHERARLGIGIKLQVPSIYPDLWSAENLWLAAYSHHRDVSKARQRAADLLHWLRLTERAHEPAANLSHGEQQRLEIGMVLAADPRIVLLDEPTAGLTRQETEETVELVRELARHASVVVVEHDMSFVRSLDVETTVLHEGAVFTSGPLEEIRRDERVLDIYLGRKHA